MSVCVNWIWYYVSPITFFSKDDNTPYAVDKNIDTLLDVLENETSALNEWFAFNFLVSNNEKSIFLSHMEKTSP